MDYQKYIEELLEAKMKRRERISHVIFVSLHVWNELHCDMISHIRYSPGSSSFYGGRSELLLNTSLGQFTIMINKDYEPDRITNDGRTLEDILVEDILLGDGDIA